MREMRLSGARIASFSGFLPGLLLGILFAQSLFFLNPHLPFSVRSIAGAMAVYGGSGAATSFVLLLLWTLGRRRETLRALPWALTLALGLAAFLGWALPAFFGYYLSPGLNVRLAKAAAWITAAGLVCFYTALLHSLYRRRYGLRSRLCFVLCALVSVTTLLERRGSFLPPAPPPDRPTIVQTDARPQLVVVGIDGASLDVILPLAELGQLPFFSGMLETGSHGHLLSLRPTRLAPLWTTVATGKLPYQHGVGASRVFRTPAIGPATELKLVPPMWPFFDWARLGTEERLTDARDRRVLALWEVLTKVGLETAVIGWPASSPLDPALAVGFSDRFFREGSASEAQPSEWVGRGRSAKDSSAGNSPGAGTDSWMTVVLREAQAEDRWRLEVARRVMQAGVGRDAVFLHLPGLRELSARLYGGFHAVQFEGLDRTPYREAFMALSGYYRWLDAELTSLFSLVNQPNLVAVLSAYGAESASGFDRLRAAVSDRRSVAGYFAGAPDGLLMLSGEGVLRGGRIDGARLVDVSPTLLYGLGFPVARDFDGRVARQAFSPELLARRPSTFIPSYDSLKSEPGIVSF